ncbi:hypothetical protein [Carboxylicivirga sp. M1479]|uniref:hypothetical protein n=1 Tax=Carboxylicivirga sp. M1479 TaxID=2594476 RepID=UPI00117807D9|nr:hypothetical protein [Carboxylicivirga sp. M1479]TRX71893.1 hypothetical protein FNN09_04535 [Carboxylicivirga sp. M1479]
MTKSLLLISITLLFLSLTKAQDKESVKQLDEWTFYGEGTKLLEGHGQYLLKENPKGSKGVGLISPVSYSENVMMRYKAMALTPATVLVAILSASDHGASSDLRIADDYDGTIKFWSGGCDNYFFAFHNAAHNYPPFVRRFDDERMMLDIAKNNVMHVGKYYAIEVGRKKNTIWLKIDGKTILKYKDPKPYSGGHLGLRIRGTGGEYAACLIKDFEIVTD